MLEISGTKTVRVADNPNERRSHNRKLAETCVKAGLYVFPSLDKRPMALLWPRIDIAIGTDGAEEAHAQARKRAAEKGHEHDEDMHVGCTNDLETVKKMWRTYPDAVPSISLGPSKLLVLDCDIDADRNGPELVTKWLTENGIDTRECPMTRSQSGGLHIYFSGEGLRSHIGKLMTSMYCQVKATGNQVVAPGAWREDGKRYMSVATQPGLCSAYAMASVPAVPEAVLKLQTEREQAGAEITNGQVAAIVDFVKRNATPEVADLDLLYDFDALAEKDAEFRAIRENPSSNASDNRFTFLKCLQREYGERLTPADYFALLQDAGGMGEFVGDGGQKQGEFNYRNFGRDLLRSRGSLPISDGTAFGRVGVEVKATEWLPEHYIEAKARKAHRNAPFEIEDQFESARRVACLTVEPLIDGLLDVGAISVVYGASNVGKTFVTAHLAYHVAAGLPWRGHETMRGAVLYFALEGRTAFRRRVVALSRAFDDKASTPAAVFGTVETPALNLKSPAGDASRIIATVRQVEERGEPVRLVVIDTLAAATPGMDESGAADMTAFLDELKRVRAACAKAHIMVVHHSGKDAARGARGHSSLRAAVDTELEISPGVITITKQRDHEFEAPIGFRLLPIELGEDERGRSMKTAIVQLLDKAQRTTGEAFGDVSAQELSEDKKVFVEAVRAALVASEGVAAKIAAIVSQARLLAPHLSEANSETIGKAIRRLAEDANGPIEKIGRSYRLRAGW